MKPTARCSEVPDDGLSAEPWNRRAEAYHLRRERTGELGWYGCPHIGSSHVTRQVHALTSWLDWLPPGSGPDEGWHLTAVSAGHSEAREDDRFDRQTLASVPWGTLTNLGSTESRYVFDVDNRFVEACTVSPCTSSNTYTFAYDGLGDRIRESGPSGSKTYTNTVVASGDAMLYLKNVVGTSTSKTVYLYAGSLLIASVSGSTTSYFHEDALGDTRLVTQKSGSSVVVVFSTNYEPFGVTYGASGTDPSVKYTGQWSEALGLYWNHARFYDPTLGRFVSADPVLGHLRNPQTLDRYAYVANNPLKYVDTNGRFIEILIGAAIGAIVGYVGCGIATGGWTSGQCGEAALAGAAVGALAGLTFGASLALAGTAGLGTATATGGFAFAGASGLAAFTFAGAT